MPLTLVTVPCLTDNYAYLIHDPGSGATAVVDVPEAGPVQSALDQHGWRLTDILITHHHPDHIAGVEALRRDSGARVWGNSADATRLPPLDRSVTPGTQESFAGEAVEVVDVPGHTIGHIAYHLPDAEMLFSGDSLMSLGCGRLFEGTPAQMLDSLTRLAALPDSTTVCSGHEYTQTNARFALTVDPDNEALRARAERVGSARDAGEPTVPVSLGEEKATNPFLRAGAHSLRAHIAMPDASDLDVFTEIRRRRDAF
jgi:hydroxyacylglutathione hydrolase